MKMPGGDKATKEPWKMGLSLIYECCSVDNLNHKNIEEWRMYQSLTITKEKRPDMYDKIELTKAQQKILKKFQNE